VSPVDAPSDRLGSRLRNVPLPEPHLAALVLGAVLERRRPWPLPGRASRRAVGWSLVAGGAGLIGAAVRASERTHLERPDRLVTAGPYARSRNPMYVGWSLVHLGTALVAGSGWILVGLPAAAAAVHRQVLTEETMLADGFGAAYERYRECVPRYVC
jgi:protein-S-isoprenylcysteine O-methyltransferase Ste14